MPETYFGGNNDMYTAFTEDISMSLKPAVEFLLTKVKTLIYNGQLDVIVNTAGAEYYINSIEWANITTWQNVQKQLLVLDSDPTIVLGTYKHYDKFTFTVIYGSGHMGPLDQPITALQMLHNYLFDKF